jgi:hypothetical protein
MRELIYKGDIESYLMDIETLNYVVCLVGTTWRTLLRDRLSEDHQNHLSTPKQEPRNHIDYVEGVRMVRLAMEEFLMLQKKQSSKDNSSSFKKSDKKRQHLEEGDKREHIPRDHGSGGKPGSKKPMTEDKSKGQTPLHMDKKKALDGIFTSLVDAQFKKGERARCAMDIYAWEFY